MVHLTDFSLNYLFNKHAIAHKKLGMGIKDRSGRREREADVERKGLKSSLPCAQYVCALCSAVVTVADPLLHIVQQGCD